MKFSCYILVPVLAASLIFSSCSKDGTADANNAATSTGQAGSLSKFTITGNFLYTVDNQKLTTYNITDPANPVLTSSISLQWGVETIYPFNDNLFIGTTTGLFIFSIADPAYPLQVGAASHARSCDPVVANDSIAYVTLKGNGSCGPAESGLYIHNIRDIFHPVLTKVVELGSPEGLGLNGSVLYICCNNDGLKVFNIADPANPVELRTISGAYFKDVIPYGNLLICYVSTGIMLYDISNPQIPVEIKLISNI